MESTLPLAAEGRRAGRTLPQVLFTNPWTALAIPLLVPLVVLFW